MYSVFPACLLLCTSLAGQQTQPIPIPFGLNANTEGNASVAAPWASADKLRSQDTYDEDNFLAQGHNVPIKIVGLRWRADGGTVGPATMPGSIDATISLGLTSSDAFGDFRDPQREFDDRYLFGIPTPHFSGTIQLNVPTGATPNSMLCEVTLDHPFVYNPNSRLLIDVQRHPGQPDVFALRDAANPQQLSSPDGISSSHRSSADLPGTTSVSQWSDVGPYVEVLWEPAVGPFATGPVSDFTFGNRFILVGDSLELASRSFSPNGPITSYEWDVDADGVTDSTVSNPTLFASSCGTTWIQLEVADSVGTDTVAGPGPTVVDAIAGFEFEPSVSTPGAFQFTDTSRGTPTSWEWDFDSDGVIDSTAQNPAWAPPAAQEYFVTLTVTGSCGTPTSSTEMINASRSVLSTIPVLGWFWNPADDTQYFDLEVLEPSGVTVDKLDVHLTYPTGIPLNLREVDIEVFVNTSTFDETHSEAARWVSVATARILAERNEWTTVDLPDFFLAQGNYAMAIELDSLHPQVASVFSRPTPEDGLRRVFQTLDLRMSTGATHYGTLDAPGVYFDPRFWHGRIHYEVGTTNGAFTPFEPGCAGTTGQPTLQTWMGATPRIGQTTMLAIESAPTLENAFLMIGFSPFAPVDLGLIGMPDCILRTEIVVTLNQITDPLGMALFSIPIPNLAGSVGATFTAQGLVVDPGANALGATLTASGAGIIGS